LQSNGKPQPTSTKLPALTFAPQPRSVKFMPRSAVRTKADQAEADFRAKLEAMKEIAAAADRAGIDPARVVPTVNGKVTPKAKAKAKKH
jgi:hypothetical protein